MSRKRPRRKAGDILRKPLGRRTVDGAAAPFSADPRKAVRGGLWLVWGVALGLVVAVVATTFLRHKRPVFPASLAARPDPVSASASLEGLITFNRDIAP